MAEIFISYRRADEPGYVGRLADSLDLIFGPGTIFRDVDSERAGGNWKKSLARSVSGSQVVLAVIGPEWQEILSGRDPNKQDWTRFELNQAHNLDIPVIPVLLAGAEFDHAADLGELAWLSDIQFFELADGQGRWQTDIARLVEEISRLTTLQAIDTNERESSGASQHSEGDQSPNVQSGGGDVTISFSSNSDSHN
jgi:hypothetical protein